MTCPGLPRAGIRTQAVVSRSWNPLSLPRPSHFTRYKCPGTSCPGKGHGAQPQQRCPASSLGRFRSTCLSPACSRPGAQVDEMGGVSWTRVQRALQGWGRQSLEREKELEMEQKTGRGRDGSLGLAPAQPRTAAWGAGVGAHTQSPSGSGKHPRVCLRPAGRAPHSGAPNGRPHQWSSVQSGCERPGP